MTFRFGLNTDCAIPSAHLAAASLAIFVAHSSAQAGSNKSNCADIISQIEIETANTNLSSDDLAVIAAAKREAKSNQANGKEDACQASLTGVKQMLKLE